MGDNVWKLLGPGSAIVAAAAAKKVMSAGWTKATGKEPPANPESPDVDIWEAVAWAVVSGALIGLARMMATRQSAKFYARSAGHLPTDVLIRDDDLQESVKDR